MQMINKIIKKFKKHNNHKIMWMLIWKWYIYVLNIDIIINIKTWLIKLKDGRRPLIIKKFIRLIEIKI